jgi:hypothetical protein
VFRTAHAVAGVSPIPSPRVVDDPPVVPTGRRNQPLGSVRLSAGEQESTNGRVGAYTQES